ncbi:MAG: hypothetical protein ACPG5U_02160 [Planktomarina sp.]
MTATDRSGNEIYGTAYKAGRGAGVPTGQADHMAQMLSRCADNAVLTAFLDHLDTPAEAAVVTTGTGLKITKAHLFRDGPLVVDALKGGAAEAVLSPMDANCACVQGFARTQGLHVAPDGSDGAVFTLGTSANPLPQRAIIDDALWQRLNRWASKTYVPETDASRLSGAGAGLTDND